jgi:hypothetical protein
MITYMNGLTEGEEKKPKMEKHKEDGLIVLLVKVKMALNRVEEKMLQKELKEDADQLVQPVKIIQEERGGKENDLV